MMEAAGLRKSWGAFLVLAMCTGGCASATQPPRALLDARVECARAEAQPNADVTELRGAHRSLNDAEYEFEQHGDSAETRRAALAAQRRAFAARAKARREASNRR